MAAKDEHRDLDEHAGPSAASSELPTGEPVIAYVAIHGIGHQRRGETAEAVADAFAAACPAVGARFVESDGENDRAGRLIVGDDSARVRFIDAWWDGHVTAPPLARVLRWMLRVTPFAVFMTIASWYLDLAAASAARQRRLKFPLELLGIAVVAIALLFTPLLMLALLILNAMAIWRPKAWPRLTSTILDTLGDAWLYRSDELDAKVLPHLRRVVEHARESADVVVLVGHSQGAEIGRRLALSVPVDACVWVGGALSQLAVTRTLRNSPLLPYLLWAYVLVSPILFSTVVAAMLRVLAEFLSEMLQGFSSLAHAILLGDATALDTAGRASDAMFALAFADIPWVLLFATFSIVAAFALRAFARWPDDLTATPDCPVTEVKSLADPVCFGGLDGASSVRYVPVRRGRAVWREHVSYFEKPETGNALLELVVSPERLPAPYEPRFGFWTKAVSVVLVVTLMIGAHALGSGIVDLIGW